MDGDIGTVLAAVGPRLRAIRRQRGVTLADLAAATGISVSTLSRLESGQRRPTLELLLPLAQAHGVPIDELAGAPPTGDPRVHIRPIRRNGRTFIPLTRRPGGVQAYKMIIPGSRRPADPELKSHEGYEWLYVLNGRLRLVLGGPELVLTPGEAAACSALDGERGHLPRGTPRAVRAAGRARPRARPLPAGLATPNRPGLVILAAWGLWRLWEPGQRALRSPPRPGRLPRPALIRRG